MYLDVTGTQDPAPTTACYETATFNDAYMYWDVTEHKILQQPHVVMKQQRSTMQHVLGM
jgi:hypothetical protein